MKTNILIILTITFMSTQYTFAQVGIGTTNPDVSSALDLTANDKGFLLPRLSTTQRDDNILNPAEGLIIYNTDNSSLEFFDGFQWINLTNSVITSGPCAGEPKALTFKDLTYKPVPSDDRCWLDRNLGASQVATSPTDADSYGDLYQWGRAADGHEKRNSPNYNVVLSTDGVANFDNDPANAWDGEFILRNSGANNWVDPTVPGVDDLWQGVNGTNNPCPTGYRVPTEAELNAERLSWGSNNAAGAYASPLKLPVAGYRFRSNGSLANVGSLGRYWSSTVSGTNARSLFFNSSNASMSTFARALGFSVRCLKD